MKKIIGLILTLAMLIGSVAMLNVSAAVTPDANAEPGSEAYTAWLVSEGYTAITDYAGFVAMMDGNYAEGDKFIMTGKYYLANDIKLENTGYLLAEGDFTGAFDGNGHTIYNHKNLAYDFLSGSWKNVTYSKYTDATKTEEVETKAPIFWGLDDGAVMENVINERNFVDIANYWGGFARKVCENATVTLKNCVNYSGIISPSPVNNHKIGGFFGMVDAGANVTFENCVNYGEVRGSQAGGFVGTINKNCTLTFKNCVNNGTIYGLLGTTSGDGSYGISGGFIAGYNNVGGLEGDLNVTLEGCVNNGNVLRLENGDPSNEKAKVTHGGLIGNLGSSTDGNNITLKVKDCVVQNCYVGGATEWTDLMDGDTVTKDYTQGYAGAIIGWLGNNYAQDSITIENVLVNNVIIRAGDPATASLFLNTNSETNNVLLKDVYAFGCTYNKVATGKYTVSNTGTATNVTVNKTQGSTPAENAMSLRFLGSVDTLDYYSVGYLVAVTVGSTITYQMVSTKTVYETVNNGSGTLSKSDFGDKYIVAMAIDGEASNVTATYTVTPFALDKDGNVVVGVAKSITLTNGVLS